MTRATPAFRAPFGYETFGTAAGLALVTGALALVVPELNALVAPLAALAVAGWAVRREGPAGPRTPWPLRACAGACALGAWVAFLAMSAPPEPPRGLVLALGLLPIWVLDLPRPRPRGAGAA